MCNDNQDTRLGLSQIITDVGILGQRGLSNWNKGQTHTFFSLVVQKRTTTKTTLWSQTKQLSHNTDKLLTGWATLGMSDCDDGGWSSNSGFDWWYLWSPGKCSCEASGTCLHRGPWRYRWSLEIIEAALPVWAGSQNLLCWDINKGSFQLCTHLSMLLMLWNLVSTHPSIINTTWDVLCLFVNMRNYISVVFLV